MKISKLRSRITNNELSSLLINENGVNRVLSGVDKVNLFFDIIKEQGSDMIVFFNYNNEYDHYRMIPASMKIKVSLQYEAGSSYYEAESLKDLFYNKDDWRISYSKWSSDAGTEPDAFTNLKHFLKNIWWGEGRMFGRDYKFYQTRGLYFDTIKNIESL